MENQKRRKWLPKIVVALGIAILLCSYWAIWIQKEYEEYIDLLRERNPVFEDRAIAGNLPVMFFELKRMLGGYSRNYGYAGYNLQLLSPEGQPYRSGPISYVVYRYFSDEEVDSINRR
jgi:hypothetical protein